MADSGQDEEKGDQGFIFWITPRHHVKDLPAFTLAAKLCA
ncbi:hypothetical protein HMPREF0208_02081 [Citrobacter koseri]|nr:hypothetical protein HMPREF0208_02081 [Citrobacter koseri]